MNRFILVFYLLLSPCVVFSKALDNQISKRDVEFLKRITPVKTKIGQVGGLDTDENGNLVVFHRGSRKWSFDSFFNDKFNTFRYGAIKEDVLALINVETMEQTDSWGSNKFYMPHGLTIDYKNNFWLTDVALHQVFKYDLSRSDDPILTIGEKFIKGNDKTHFCKPTSVAVSQLTDDIFVGDGYCNKRIVHLDHNGNYIKEFEDKDQPMIVVHSLALLDDERLICAASREDGRIVCFDIDSGDKRFVITDQNMETVYAIVYDPINQVIHAATGDNRNKESFGLTFDASPINFGNLIQKWSHKNEDLSDAHDIAISPNGNKIYIGQLNGELDLFDFKKK